MASSAGEFASESARESAADLTYAVLRAPSKAAQYGTLAAFGYGVAQMYPGDEDLRRLQIRCLLKSSKQLKQKLKPCKQKTKSCKTEMHNLSNRSGINLSAAVLDLILLK